MKSSPNESFYDIVEDFALHVDEDLYKCWWKNKIRDCSKCFVPVFTEDGICVTFNALNSHEIYTNE